MQQSRARPKGCLVLIGLVLVGVGLMTGVVGVGGTTGLLRSDPVGLVLLAAVVGLVGLLVVLLAARMR